MKLCECGCGQAIVAKPHHKYHPPRFLPNHFAKTGQARRGQRISIHRIEAAILCACGCGLAIPPRYPDGKPRYGRSQAGNFIHGHNMKGKRGANHPQWNGGRYRHRNYWYVYLPEHPTANAQGYIFEHRLIWEQVHHRLLMANEHIHHINGNGLDNRPKNLVALTISKHRRGHILLNPIPATREQRQEAGRKGAYARWHKACEP